MSMLTRRLSDQCSESTASAPLPLLDPIVSADDQSVMMSLRGVTKSPGSAESIRVLALILNDLPGRSSYVRKTYIVALAAIVNDLLRCGSYVPVRSCFRPMGVENFKGSRVGYKPFVRVIKDMAAHRLITVEVGSELKRRVTRIRPTIALFNKLAAFDLTPHNRAEQFSNSVLSVPTKKLLRLRGPSRWEGPDKIAGKLLKFDVSAPKPAMLADQVRRYNDYASQQTYEGVDFEGVFRNFNQGHLPDYAWDKGGRIYHRGGGFLSVPRRDRPLIKINDDAVVELDIKACQPTILHALCGVQLPNRADLYDIPDFPREIVKLYVTAMLGKGRPLTKWGDDQKLRAAEEGFLDISIFFPVQTVEEAVLSAIPVLKVWDSSVFNWADLQYIESSIIMDTMLTLAEDYDVPALSIHDAIFVQTKHQEIALRELEREFYVKTGLSPRISLK